MSGKIKTSFNHRNLIAITGLFILISLFFAKLFYPNLSILATSEQAISDIWYFNFPLKNFLAESLKSGNFPLWNQHMSGGFPVLANSQIGVFHFYNFLAFKFLPAIYAFNLAYIATFFQAALGMFLYLRQIKFSPLTSFYGAFLFSFSGFFVTHLAHFSNMQAAVFLPWLFWVTELLLEKPKLSLSLVFAVLFSQQIFAGAPQFTFITIFALFIYIAGKIYISKPKKTLGYFILGLGAGLIISAVQLLPTLELLKLSSRSHGNLTEVLGFTFQIKDFLTLINPFIFGNPHDGTYSTQVQLYQSIFWENTAYIGIIPLFLVILTFFKIKQFRNGRIYLVMLTTSVLLMLGGDGPLRYLFMLPPFSLFRFTARFLVVFTFIVVVLAVQGLSLIQKSILNRSKYQSIFLVILVLFSIGDIFWIWRDYHNVVPFADFQKVPQAVEIIKNDQPGMVYMVNRHARAIREAATNGWSKPDRLLELRNEIAPNLNLLYNLSTPDSYSTLAPRRIDYYNSLIFTSYQLTNESQQLDFLQLRLISLRDTTHILSAFPLTNSDLSLYKKFELTDFDNQPMYIYKNKAAVPKYYLISKFKIVTTIEDFLTQVTNPDFDPKTEAVVEKPLTAPSSSLPILADINVLQEQNAELKLAVNTNQAGVLVITNSYYPGWEATVDGKQQEIFPVNFINQGLWLNQGKHQIYLRYNPSSFRFGLFISAVGYGAIIIYFLNLGLRHIYVLKKWKNSP
ncbi:MAG: hypothetical protein UV55_C0014G0012 [Candidatus Gottesmanbacteria bacterium GW2011_GWC1_43_10]|nr:MAG: hypothetical protein UV55_C0014G0012 [Candidatus Gottesmanbacteria bacterium GW2011_GWC1_43_10]